MSDTDILLGNAMKEALYCLPKDAKQNSYICMLQLLVGNFGHCKFEPTNQDLMKVTKTSEYLLKLFKLWV